MGKVIVGLLGIFILGMGWIYGPVAAAEVRYQALNFLREQGIDDVRELVVPDFSLNLAMEEPVDVFGIEIPKLFIKTQVLANVDPFDEEVYAAALKQGVAHAKGTGMPDEQKQGYYFAHSSAGAAGLSQYNAVFYLIHKLERGDEIYLWHRGKRVEFVVRDTQVVPADDVSVLTDPQPERTIVLQTCWPPGVDSKRLLVTAERV